jgi:hypothetical protein
MTEGRKTLNNLVKSERFSLDWTNEEFLLLVAKRSVEA